MRARSRSADVAAAQCGPLGAVEDEALGHAHVAAEHELLLHEVLDGLDRHVGDAERVRPLVHAVGHGLGGRRVRAERQERLADRRLDLGRVPAHDLAGAADQPRRAEHRRPVREHHGAAHDQRLGHVEAPFGDQRGLERGGALDGHRDASDRPAVGLGQGGDGVGDQRGGVAHRERAAGQGGLLELGVEHDLLAIDEHG